MIECRCSMPLTSLLIALLSNPHMPLSFFLKIIIPSKKHQAEKLVSMLGRQQEELSPGIPFTWKQAFPPLQAQVPTRNGCFPRIFCWTQAVNCQKEFVYLCGCGEQSSYDDFLITHWLNATEMGPPLPCPPPHQGPSWSCCFGLQSIVQVLLFSPCPLPL